jgi:hypothetical protein
MATTTTNFGWDIPQSTDLVKDGATAIAALGQDIDTAMVDLKGGTTGQVLAKASGTDLDFSWVAQDDSNAIQNAIVDAKGDLIGATAADTPARLAVGTNGQVLTADSTEATGLKWTTPAAGALVLIGTTTLSSSGSFNLTSIFSSTYDDYQIHFSGITSTSTSFFTFGLRAGGTNKTSNYSYMYNQITYANSALSGGGTGGGDAGAFNYSTTAGSAVIKVLNPFNTAATTLLNDFAVYNAGGINRYLQTESVSYDSFWVTPNSGTISGKVMVYGYAK